MCRTPNSAVFRAIANNPEAPDAVRAIALDEISRVASVQIAVTNSVPAVVAPPTTGNKSFTCTIFSLGNKDTLETLQLTDISQVPNPDDITQFPGVKVKDSSGFLAKDADGQHDLSDPALTATFDGYHAVYDFYKTVFNRESIDDKGMEIRASIHLSRGYNNAFWSRQNFQMCFGDSGRFDGRGWLAASDIELNKSPSEAIRCAGFFNWHAFYLLDVIGHEITHGVVHYTSELGEQQENDLNNNEWTPARKAAYSEAGTLNEHIADCFGIMLTHYVVGATADKGNWLMGKGMWTDYAMKANNWVDNYMRTFSDTGAKSADSGSPRHWNNKIPFEVDPNDPTAPGLDPHVNNGIANHAFYLAAIAFTGKSWETVGKIWYNALLDPTFKDPTKQTFKGWRDLTVSWADKLFPSGGKDKMTNAWSQVGL